MAKKTAKKSKKKTTKKTGKKATARTAVRKTKGLWAKIHAVSAKVKEVPSSGEELDEQGEKYNFTQAKEVFRIYGDALNEFGLTFMPIAIVTDLDPRFYRATVTYRITDIDTGDWADVVGAGLGCNGVWSVNSCQTVARKQALLNAFGASYGEKETNRSIVKKQLDGFNIRELVDIQTDPVRLGEAVRAEMDKFIDERVGKKKG